MGAALKGLGDTFLPGLVIGPQDRSVLNELFGYGLGQAAILIEEGMAALRAKRWTLAANKAATILMLSGKFSTKFGGRNTAMRLFIVGTYIQGMAVERKKAAARMKKAASMTGLAFKLANLKSYTTALSR